jgi:predicted extracellular nuclease
MSKILLSILIFLSGLQYLKAQSEEEEIDSTEIQVKDTLSPQELKKKMVLEADSLLLKMGMDDFDDQSRDGRGIRACFYNVENLFDTEDDTLINDDEFLPKGAKGWSYTRYQQKLNNIYKTMSAVGGWGGPPEINGFCEIENKRVLEDLLKKTPYQKYNYKIVHENSPDARGIDVGFIYRPTSFQYIGHEAIRVKFPFDTLAKTRDVLHVWGTVMNKDTLHVFVNHWPSRRGGQAASEPRRVFVAGLIRAKIDSIYKSSSNANILVMGDFNDDSENKSLHKVLRAKHHENEVESNDMFNYMHELSKNWKFGSHKYQGHWGTLDHIIVSSPLLKNKEDENRLHAGKKGAKIFTARFLLEEDKRYMGFQPFRTYGGPKFLGGFSDHLPVYIDLIYKN